MLLGWSSSRPGGLEGTGDEALPWPQPRAGSGLLHLDVAEDPKVRASIKKIIILLTYFLTSILLLNIFLHST